VTTASRAAAPTATGPKRDRKRRSAIGDIFLMGGVAATWLMIQLISPTPREGDR
jgi:hypothetical protein